MSTIYKLLLILSVTQVSYCCQGGFFEKSIHKKIDYSGRFIYPWIVVIHDISELWLGVSYGSIIHPKAVLTAAIDMEGHDTDNLIVRINCKINEDLVVKECTIRNVMKIIYPDDYDGQPTPEKFYALLILQTPFDITPTTQPISLTNSMELVDGESCRVFHWLRLYSFKSDSYGVVPENFSLPYVNGAFDFNSMNLKQMKTSRDFIINYQFSYKTAREQKLLPLPFSGSPLVCLLKNDTSITSQVGIATFNLKLRAEPSQAEVVERVGSLFLITDYYDEIMKKLKEIII